MEIRDTRNGDWHWVYNALLADPHLTTGEKLVYSAISTFGGHEVIHPTKEQISERCSLDEKTVQRAIKRLEEVGYMSMDKSTGRGNANVYYLLKKPKGCNLCPFIKGDIEDQKRGHFIPEKGAETTPHIDIYKDKKDISKTAVLRGVTPPKKGEEEITIVADNGRSTDEPRKKSTAKYPNARTIFSWFPRPQSSWNINTTELTHAELLYQRDEREVRSAISFIVENRENKFCPKVTKPSDLEKKWLDILDFKRKNHL